MNEYNSESIKVLSAEDWMSHSSPQRNTTTYQERNFERIIYGHPMLDALFKKVTAKA